MYYRRNDSRMGDEVFAMGILLAPLVWKIVKKGQAFVCAQVEKFNALPEEEQRRKKYRMLRIGELVLCCFILIDIGSAFLSIFNGHFALENMISIVGCMIVEVFIKLGKKKYENYSEPNVR